jgi:hypothetical protein
VNQHEPIGVAERQRLEEQRMQHGENGHVGPDAERERRHRRKGEPGLLAERAGRVGDVLFESRHRRSFGKRRSRSAARAATPARREEAGDLPPVPATRAAYTEPRDDVGDEELVEIAGDDLAVLAAQQ